jgi:hypothetical protein
MSQAEQPSKCELWEIEMKVTLTQIQVAQACLQYACELIENQHLKLEWTGQVEDVTFNTNSGEATVEVYTESAEDDK